MGTTWLHALIGALAFSGACASVAAEPPPLEAFFENPQFTDAALSPSGTHLAVRFAPSGGRQQLAVANLADMSVRVVGSFNDLDVNRFHWVNDERLVFDSVDSRTAAGDARRARGMWAVNRDGSLSRQLVDTLGRSFVRSPNQRKTQPWNTFFLKGGFPQDSEYIYVGRYSVKNFLVDTVELLRLNTLTGQERPVAGPPDVRYWIFDAKGEPRLVLRPDGPREIMYYRDTGDWRELASYNRVLPPLEATGFAPDGSFYVAASQGKDKLSLYKMDLATGKLATAPLISVEGFDFDGQLVGTDRLLGVRFRGDAESTYWFDDKMKAVQARVDEKLPATVNKVSVAARASAPWVLVTSQSDASPTTFWAFNTGTGALSPVGSMLPRIDPAQMSRTKMVRYKARDGLEIPGWLTLPRDGAGKNLPLVVIVHNGPHTRGRGLEWNAPAQFLASRGYAVLEPEYRGSTGFGLIHTEGGRKQWGLKMQDDLADGARWAIAQGIADPGRICIAGSGYGGYAALMGVAKDADLFQCAVSHGGVTDLQLLFTGHWAHDSASSEFATKYSMPELIGDPDKDAAQLKATSPIALAAGIKRPVLLAYGERDVLVPVIHGKRFRGDPRIDAGQEPYRLLAPGRGLPCQACWPLTTIKLTRRCRTTWQMAPAGQSPKAWPIRSASASWAAATAVTPRSWDW
jgi:dipeptidyl aminopeptidase/acylaminoacyl peptidase